MLYVWCTILNWMDLVRLQVDISIARVHTSCQSSSSIEMTLRFDKASDLQLLHLFSPSGSGRLVGNKRLLKQTQERGGTPFENNFFSKNRSMSVIIDGSFWPTH